MGDRELAADLSPRRAVSRRLGSSSPSLGKELGDPHGLLSWVLSPSGSIAWLPTVARCTALPQSRLLPWPGLQQGLPLQGVGEPGLAPRFLLAPAQRAPAARQDPAALWCGETSCAVVSRPAGGEPSSWGPPAQPGSAPLPRGSSWQGRLQGLQASQREPKNQELASLAAGVPPRPRVTAGKASAGVISAQQPPPREHGSARRA